MNIVRTPKWLLVSSLVLAVAWSVLMWAVYGVLSMTDEGLTTLFSRMGVSRQTEEWALWTGLLLQDVGNVAAIVMWSVGLVALVLLTWIARAVLARWPIIRERLQSMNVHAGT